MKKIGLIVLSAGLLVGTVSFSALACSQNDYKSNGPTNPQTIQYEQWYGSQYEPRYEPAPQFGNYQKPNWFDEQKNSPDFHYNQFKWDHRDNKQPNYQPQWELKQQWDKNNHSFNNDNWKR